MFQFFNQNLHMEGLDDSIMVFENVLYAYSSQTFLCVNELELWLSYFSFVLPFYYTTSLIATEFPMFCVIHWYLFLNGITFYSHHLSFGPPFYEWLKLQFGVERLNKWVGNAPFITVVRRH